MPCYTIRVVSVEFKVQNKDLLLEVLKKVNARIYSDDGNYLSTSYGDFDLDKGMITTKMSASTVNMMKRQYTLAAVEKAAALRRWFVKKESDVKLTLRRL